MTTAADLAKTAAATQARTVVTRRGRSFAWQPTVIVNESTRQVMITAENVVGMKPSETKAALVAAVSSFEDSLRSEGIEATAERVRGCKMFRTGLGHLRCSWIAA